LEIHLTELK